METTAADRCQAEWYEMQPTRIPEAKDLARAVSKQFNVEVGFHTHDLKKPSGDVLFGARFCGAGADTYHAAKAWKEGLEAAAKAVAGA